MRNRIGLLLILACLLPAVAAQQQVRDKTEGGASRADMAQRNAEEVQRRAQAVDILKGVVESAADIQETRTRVTILTGALDLLWKHDEAYTEASLRKLDWDGFNAQVNRVSDARLRAYLVLTAASTASNASNKEMFSEFLVAAMSLFSKIEDADARAAALVTAAGILYAGADPSWGAQVLTDGVKAINRADRYDGSVYSVTLKAGQYKVWLPIPRSDLSHCFEQAAKRDWPASIAAAEGIESKALRSQAYIAASRSVL